MIVVYIQQYNTMYIYLTHFYYRPHLKDHGSVDISGHSISLSVSADLKENKTSGGVRLNSTSCSFSIGSLKVHFHGGAR